MAINRRVVWILLLLVEVALSHSIISPTTNPFDGGPLSSCEKPTFKADSICSDVVSYSVPTSVARLSTIIESMINNSVMEVSSNCSDSYRKVMCLHRFPRCQWREESSSFEVILNEQTHTPMLIEHCGNDEAGRLSKHEITFTVDDSCSPISELTGDFKFSRCLVNMENLVTRWMMEYLKAVDLTISKEAAFLYDIPDCGHRLVFHRCNFIGKCTGKGSVEFTNSYDDCISATSW